MSEPRVQGLEGCYPGDCGSVVPDGHGLGVGVIPETVDGVTSDSVSGNRSPLEVQL